MKNDIQSRIDIETLVQAFYTKVRNENSLNKYFSKVIPVDWNLHYVKMADFWENILFFTGNYDGNLMEAHKRINEKQTMVPNEFEIWIKLFCSTVDELFEGKNAEKIKSSSTQIALIMKAKIYTA